MKTSITNKRPVNVKSRVRSFDQITADVLRDLELKRGLKRRAK